MSVLDDDEIIDDDGVEFTRRDDDDDDDNDGDDILESAVATTTIASVASFSASASTSGGEILNRMRLNQDKNGMEDCDATRISRIIEDASKGSSYYENEQRKQQRTQVAIEKMLKRVSAASATELRRAEQKASAMIAEFERERTFDRMFLHVDMDAFYAAVAERDNPELRGKPVGVGGMSMLSTSNYEARKFGVRAAMPGFIARKLCPDLIIVPSDFEAYHTASRHARSVFAKFDASFVTFSLDEALLDVTDVVNERMESLDDEINDNNDNNDNNNDNNDNNDDDHDDDDHAALRVSIAMDIAREIQFHVYRLTNLTCSVGVGCNGTLAKIATSCNKPRGCFAIMPRGNDVIEFLKALAVRKIPFCGKVLEAYVRALGIRTIDDVRTKRAVVVLALLPAAQSLLLRATVGAFSSMTTGERHSVRKSISSERTTRKLLLADGVQIVLDQLCNRLASQMQAEGIRGHNVTVKWKKTDFTVHSNSITLVGRSVGDSAATLSEVARALIAPHLPLRLRLLGVRIGALDCKDEPAKLPPDQPTLASFFGAAQSTSTTTGSTSTTTSTSLGRAVVAGDTACPLCNTDLSSRSVLEASAHVDRCLRSPPKTTNATATTRTTTTTTTKRSAQDDAGQTTLLQFAKRSK